MSPSTAGYIAARTRRVGHRKTIPRPDGTRVRYIDPGDSFGADIKAVSNVGHQRNSGFHGG